MSTMNKKNSRIKRARKEAGQKSQILQFTESQYINLCSIFIYNLEQQMVTRYLLPYLQIKKD